jgi:hypothetical protein
VVPGRVEVFLKTADDREDLAKSGTSPKNIDSRMAS